MLKFNIIARKVKAHAELGLHYGAITGTVAGTVAGMLLGCDIGGTTGFVKSLFSTHR